MRVPGDKSVSHRTLILGALAPGESLVEGLLESADVHSTRSCLTRLGARIERLGQGKYRVNGFESGPEEPREVLDCGNSGTTVRLLMGLVAAHPISCVFAGDASLSERPMERVVRPLSEAGATFLGRAGSTRLPLAVRGGNLRPLDHRTPVASAQVKSCLLLAALNSTGTWRVTEPAATRDHTERMLEGAGVVLWRDGSTVELTGPQRPRPLSVTVVGDISSAAFFIAAGLLAADDGLALQGVSLNPSRTGFLDAVKAMGGSLEIVEGEPVSGEPQGRLVVRRSQLTGTTIGGSLVPRLIDEIPILAVLAATARGRTVIRDAAELRAKECDRIKATVEALDLLGAKVQEQADGLIIDGVTELVGAEVASRDDHRIAMSMAIAGLAARGTTTIARTGCVDISYPSFWTDLARVAPDALHRDEDSLA
ncbi:MAG: 3-phosphoshikimate 1-carboxyvinyltransferase [Candidatus Riflebacteria bacterium]|nr:3-phosphoshikimate 1-carboxyvinyltransferase [Candidatus Riflebacteria bacterium]